MGTLMFAISIPGLTDEDDPDDVADRVVAYLNDAGFAEERITVSLWPFPQWFGVEAMEEMKALGAELRLRKVGSQAMSALTSSGPIRPDAAVAPATRTVPTSDRGNLDGGVA